MIRGGVLYDLKSLLHPGGQFGADGDCAADKTVRSLRNHFIG
jgi:hypothetical protein